MRAARILPLHGLSMPERYLMCIAGYRVTPERPRFLFFDATAVITAFSRYVSASPKYEPAG
jgi:hypothetical protein